MAFTFRSPTLSGHIDEEEVIVFEMIRLLGLDLPLLLGLDRNFYESPRVPRGTVGQLREEALRALRAFKASSSTRPSAFERALLELSPHFREAAKSLRPSDPERCLASLIVVCDDALAHDADVECLSD